jgi:hypothetical protein
MGGDSVARLLLQSRVVAALLFSSLLQIASPVVAQSDNKAAARQHFEKGVAAFDDRRFAEAAEEFDAAYRLSPAFVVLYNIGQVDVALGRSVEAVDAFEKYLKQGASTISDTRRQEVLDEIEKQSARIGTIAVRTLPEGATVRLDGVLVGKTPLPGPLRVTAGRHTVEAVLAEHTLETREIIVAGRSHESLEITLASIAAAVAPAQTPAPRPPLGEHAIIEEHVFMENQNAAPPAATKPAVETVVTPTPHSSVNWQRIIGVVITVGGVATATVGGVMAFQGNNQANDAKDRLAIESGAAYDADKVIFDDGKSRNQRGWITAAVGAGIVVGGVVVVATAPDRSSSVALAPSVGVSGGGFTMSGAW